MMGGLFSNQDRISTQLNAHYSSFLTCPKLPRTLYYSDQANIREPKCPKGPLHRLAIGYDPPLVFLIHKVDGGGSPHTFTYTIRIHE
jgi:hypothetical protein